MKQLLLVFLIACGGSSPKPAAPQPKPAEPAPAPVASSATNDVVAQAELADQYEVGKKVYVAAKCASCHGDHGEGNPKNPPVIGPNAFPEQAPAAAKLRKGVEFRTAKDVLDFVKAKMPIKHPGTLSEADADAVVSWMLSESKVPIERKLDASNAASVKLR